MTELDRLHQRGLFFCAYLEGNLPPEKFTAGMREALDRAYREKNLKGCRMALRDIDAWVTSWDDLPIRIELNRQWKAGPGAGQPPFGGTPRALAGILRRGLIMTMEEYRIVHDYLSDYDWDEKTGERLNAMMKAFKIP